MVYYCIQRGQKVNYGANVDTEQISRDCGLYDDLDYKGIISNIVKLESEYEESELIQIYNYMLSKTSNPDVIMFLIQCEDKYRHPSSLEVLVDILLFKNAAGCDENIKEKYVGVRVMCAKAIANQKNTNVVNSLLYCLNNKDENYRVRLACADALGKIGDKYAVAPLIEVVKDEEEKSVYVRESAATALGLLGDYRAVEPLVSILETKQGIMDKFSFLKERVIEALDKMGFNSDERVFRALRQSLADESSQVRIEAIEAIMNSEHPKAYDIIKECMINDTDEEVKRNALIALYNMSDRKILEEVIQSSKYSGSLKIAAQNIIDEYEGDE